MKPKTVGLTGGIGSGKSTVAKLFEELGIPVFYSDDEAKKVYENPEVQHEMSELIGESLFEQGILNRKLLADKLFAQPDLRQQVNAIIHPRVREAFAHFVNSYADKPYIINEAAILFETGTYKQFDFMVLVIAPEAIKVERIKQRDQISAAAVHERMKAQWKDEQKIPLAQFIIQNDEKHGLKEQVMHIHGQLTKDD